jgi:hypothetical protein
VNSSSAFHEVSPRLCYAFGFPVYLLPILPNGACFTSASPHWQGGEGEPLAASQPRRVQLRS